MTIATSHPIRDVTLPSLARLGCGAILHHMESKMENFTLNVPALVLNVESRDVIVPIDLGKIPHHVLNQVLAHGIKQKVADAASGVAMAAWLDVKGKDAPKPSRDQLKDFSESNMARIKTDTLAAMQKAADALIAGQWMVREAGGTSTKMTDEQSLAVDIAKDALKARFIAALAKAAPNVKPTAAAFVALSPKVAAFFKANDSRPTWDDKPVIAWIAAQAESGARDFMAEAREELARREAASAVLPDDLDDLLGDI